MARRRRFALPTLAGAGLLAAALSLAAGEGVPGDGWLYDTALWARARLAPPPEPGGPVAVIGIDARSLDAPELVKLPRVLFSPVWAKLLNALAEAEAAVVGFDLVFAYSGNNLQQGYDREFQRALHTHREKVVLGRSAATLPDRAFLGALRFDPGALGYLELSRDDDGVHRRLPTVFPGADGKPAAGMTAALLARAGAGPAPPVVLLAPERHLEAIPTYSLIDVLRCAETEPAALKRAFAGRIVLVGSVLPEEDRVLTAARFLPQPKPAEAAAACPPPTFGASVPGSAEVPGVHLHAAAAEAVLTGRVAQVAGAHWRVALAVAVAIAGAALGLGLAPWTALAAALGLAAAAWAGEVAALRAQVWLPAGLPMALALGSTFAAYLVRYLVEERRRRQIQRAFGRYLAPAVVAELADNPGELKLGGRVLPTTIMFADLSGFTKLSTTVGPEELVRLTNRYLAIVADLVDGSDGYVDKFIGDAVMAIWGAPVPNPGHIDAGVDTAMAIRRRIAEAAAEATAKGEHAFGIKIGLHSGDAIVGNVGSEKRYNYTAVGETVNIAARMEGLPGVYGCTLLIGPTSAEAVKGRILLREIDWVAVKGRAAPLAIYEPIAPHAEATPEELALAARHGEALALYRQRRFEQAAAIWEGLGEDGPSAVMAERAREFASNPPPEDWDGVYVMTGK